MDSIPMEMKLSLESSASAVFFIAQYIHVHLGFIPEGVAEAPQIFLRDAYVMRNTTDVSGGNPITV
jgi:hypothetical protein